MWVYNNWSSSFDDCDLFSHFYLTSICAWISIIVCLFAFRGLFIIDDKGTLRQITMNDLPVGRSVDETLRLVQAFQYTDKHGEGTHTHTE